jgi:Leucine-rich repeat (LRR) protein
MVRQIAYHLLLCVAIGYASHVQSQVLSTKDLDTARVFTNLDQALLNPDAVLRLDLSKQKLSSIPDDVFRLHNLQELILNKCRINELPNRFSGLPHLQRLECEHNEIDSIPPSIFTLKHLKTLNLADNIIESIPDEVDRLDSLETLALWDNPIGYYPERLTEMQHLKVLDVLNNAMSRETQQRLKTGLPNCKLIMSPPCACMDGQD